MRGWRAAPPRCSCSSSGPKSSLSTSSAGTESWSPKTARAHRTRSPNAARPSGDKVLSPACWKTRSASMTSGEPYAASRAFAWEKSSDPCWRFPCALWARATKTSVIAAATSSSRCRWASSHRCATPLNTTTARAAVAPISAAATSVDIPAPFFHGRRPGLALPELVGSAHPSGGVAKQCVDGMLVSRQRWHRTDRRA